LVQPRRSEADRYTPLLVLVLGMVENEVGPRLARSN
jgi:hypothetical protein